jgi:hypothetical protein
LVGARVGAGIGELMSICQPKPSILSWVTQCNLAHDQATSGQVAGALFIFATRISFGFKLQKSISDSILIHKPDRRPEWSYYFARFAVKNNQKTPSPSNPFLSKKAINIPPKHVESHHNMTCTCLDCLLTHGDRLNV